MVPVQDRASYTGLQQAQMCSNVQLVVSGGRGPKTCSAIDHRGVLNPSLLQGWLGANQHQQLADWDGHDAIMVSYHQHAIWCSGACLGSVCARGRLQLAMNSQAMCSSRDEAIPQGTGCPHGPHNMGTQQPTCGTSSTKFQSGPVALGDPMYVPVNQMSDQGRQDYRERCDIPYSACSTGVFSGTTASASTSTL
eukprot:2276259-Amphidinium_carterae.4